MSPEKVNAQIPWELSDTTSINAYVRSVQPDGSVMVTTPVAVTIVPANPGIFARLRSFAANILRFNGIHNVSDGRHRIAFSGISAILAMRVMY